MGEKKSREEDEISVVAAIKEMIYLILFFSSFELVMNTSVYGQKWIARMRDRVREYI